MYEQAARSEGPSSIGSGLTGRPPMETTKVSPMSMSFNNMTEKLDRLERISKELIGRLQPILSPSDTKSEPSMPMAKHPVSLCNEIDLMANRIHNSNAMLAHILEQIAL